MNKFQVLDHLSEEEIEKLYALSTMKTFKKQEIIFHKNDLPQYLYVLLEGQIYVCDDTLEGSKNIMTIINNPMDCFGEVYLFMNMAYPFYAQARIPSKVLCIPRDVLSQFPQISNNMNVMLSQKAYVLSQKLQLLMKDSLKEKILEYMHQHTDVILKRHEMASYLGVSRPALSKELYRMVDEGLLEIDEDGHFKTVI